MHFECFQFPEHVLKLAESLRDDYDGCVHSPKYPGFNYMTADEAKSAESRRNEENSQRYYALCGELVGLCNNSALHWRHQEIAQSLVSLLLRRDIEYPHAAVLIFSKFSTYDKQKRRKHASDV